MNKNLGGDTRMPTPQGPWYCWGCHAQIRSEAEGVSLAANSDLHVCTRCYERLSIVERITLEHRLRSTLAGGMGLSDLATVAAACMAVFCEYCSGAMNTDEPEPDDGDEWKHA